MGSPTKTTDHEATRLTLIAEAAARHAEFPRYAGHWDDWQLGQVVRDIQWRGYKGPQFLSAVAGEFVLVKPQTSGIVAHLPSSAVGSGRGCDTLLCSSLVKVVPA